jgi:Na+/melibiose symporter-like transporter
MKQVRTTHDRVALATRVAYGFGSISEGVKNTAFNSFLLFYYNAVLGLSGTLSGAAILLALVVDAITDPLVGSLSDNWHSRWGRRHPFLYASALPMGISFWLLFNPPAGLGSAGLFVWFTTFAVLVRSAMTLYSIPTNAMVAELTPNYDERTSLISWRYVFGWRAEPVPLAASARVATRYGLHVTASAGPVDRRYELPPAEPFAAPFLDELLDDIAAYYGADTAEFVAVQLEYRSRGARFNPGSGSP